MEITGLTPGFQYQVAKAGDTLRLTALKDGLATSPPRLSIQWNGAEIILSWAPTALGYTLQSVTNLSAPTWQPLATTSNSVTLPLTSVSKFFRLVR